MNNNDHQIFIESMRHIQNRIGVTGLDVLQQKVLERLIHSSGDFGLAPLLRFSLGACQKGVAALQAGAPILTDTAMAAAAVQPMSFRTLNSLVKNILEWAPDQAPLGSTRSAKGMELAWKDLSRSFVDRRSPIVLIGSAPTALEILLDIVESGAPAPSLIIGMPVGFIGVANSKKRLAMSGFPNIVLQGSRGGAALAAATVNALLSASTK